MMTTLFFYIVAATPDPDNVRCPVPFQINDRLIFFGPCKKSLRELLKRRFLKGASEVKLKDDIYLVGVNGANNQRVRKILWAGRITHLMRFETAYNTLTDSEFEEMRSRPYSPLHVKPIYNSASEFIGYENCSREHRDNDLWRSDLTKKVNEKQFYLEPRRLLLRENVHRDDAFERDCCFLCENIFFANGNGLPITSNIVEILRRAQRGKNVDEFAVFGYSTNNHVEGKRGNYLTISGRDAVDLIKQIEGKANPLPLKAVNSVNRGCD